MKIRKMKIRTMFLALSCAMVFSSVAFGQSNQGCIQVTPANGSWQLKSCFNQVQNVAFTQPNVRTPNGGNAANLNTTFVLFPGQTYTEGDSRYAYKYFTCISPAVPMDVNTNTAPNYYSTVDCSSGSAGSAE